MTAPSSPLTGDAARAALPALEAELAAGTTSVSAAVDVMAMASCPSVSRSASSALRNSSARASSSATAVSLAAAS